jgi:hypothetical protein
MLAQLKKPLKIILLNTIMVRLHSHQMGFLGYLFILNPIQLSVKQESVSYFSNPVLVENGLIRI